MTEQTLNGMWQYRIGKGKYTPVRVPFSRLPVGQSACFRTFDLDRTAERVFLKFEGITYGARVLLNDKILGEMLPYSEYVFEITDTVLEKDNRLLVELEDIHLPFGPSEGWENYGGIIRNVSLLYADTAYIEDVFFHCELQNAYRDATFWVELAAHANPDDVYRVELRQGEQTLLSYTQQVCETSAPHALQGVDLWSPDDPRLYELQVSLLHRGAVVDAVIRRVGFREFRCERHRFLLNGAPLFLKGVCKHEMIGDSGHTPTVAQIEEDLRRIKEIGCNFVRLVHYPHCKETLDIADRLGLMVSEEPGLWWSDTADPAVSRGSLEVLRRTVLRDRNHPCVVFWLCFNECRFTEQFLLDSARVCRENDPTRPVSGANCMSNEDTLKYYNLCGFDFYTMHPYAQSFKRSAEAAAMLYDKPLMFTEWGGHFVYDNPKLIGEFIGAMMQLYRANSDEGALAGAAFWCWAELNDFNRSAPACHDGVLKEGLMTSDRRPNMILAPFCKAWEKAEHPALPADAAYAQYDAHALAGKTPLCCCSEKSDDARLMVDAELPLPLALSRMRPRKLVVGPILQTNGEPGLSSAPWVLFDQTVLEFSGCANTDTVTLIGAVSVGKGYPVAGEYGEAAALLTVESADGGRETFELCNGVDFTTVFATLSSSRIDPIAENATRFGTFGYNKNYENYILNRLDLKLSREAKVTRVILSSLARGYDLLVYGVYL